VPCSEGDSAATVGTAGVQVVRRYGSDAGPKGLKNTIVPPRAGVRFDGGGAGGLRVGAHFLDYVRHNRFAQPAAVNPAARHCGRWNWRWEARRVTDSVGDWFRRAVPLTTSPTRASATTSLRPSSVAGGRGSVVGLGRIVGACAGEPVWCYAWCKINGLVSVGRSNVRILAGFGRSGDVGGALYAGRAPNASLAAVRVDASTFAGCFRRLVNRCCRNRRCQHCPARR